FLLVGQSARATRVRRRDERLHRVQPVDQVAHLGTAGSGDIRPEPSGSVDTDAGAVARLEADVVMVPPLVDTDHMR
ncbi:MAG: hypothetical protein PVG71_07910, partial [Anaerolineae bacterium]